MPLRTKILLQTAIIVFFTLRSGSLFACSDFGAPTSSMEKIPIKIENTYFEIPEAFIVNQLERIPGEKKYLHIALLIPGYIPYGTVRSSKSPEHLTNENIQDKTHKVLCYMIVRSQFIDKIHRNLPLNDKFSALLTGGMDAIQEFDPRNEGNIEKTINENEVKKVLLSFIVKDKPSSWDELVGLVSKLNISSKSIRSLSIPANPPLSVDFLENAIKHKNEVIRVAAIEQMGNLEPSNFEQVRKLLLYAMQNDPDDYVREKAIKVLSTSRSGDQSLISILGKIAESDSSTMVRESALRELEKLKN